MVDQQRIESLGPAERIVAALTTYTDHMMHGRPGIVTPVPGHIGVKWEPATWKLEGDQKVVSRLTKVGKKTVPVRVGVLQPDLKVAEGGREVAEFRNPGLFPEVVAWMYGQVAEVYKLDNEFAARWASWAYAREHRDLKVILAAFLLVQARKGDPVLDEGKVSFHDDDYRDVGEAMLLLHDPKKKNEKSEKGEKGEPPEGEG